MNEIKYDKPPLLCVVVSIQFEKVATFSNHRPALFKLFPEAGFSDLDAVTMNNIEFGAPGNEGPKVTWRETLKWDFKDSNRSTLIRLDENGIAIHFADYRFFEKKKKALREILGVLGKAIPSLLVREYAIRYINHIPVPKNEDLSHWVNPAILGLPNQPGLGLERLGSVSESIFQTEVGGHLVVRCSTMGGGLTVPPDLFPIDLRFAAPGTSELPFIRLENVHLLAVNESFDPSLALEKISSLREPISALFTALTTPDAHRIWQQQPTTSEPTRTGASTGR